MKYNTKEDIAETGVNMDDFMTYMFGQTGGIVDGELVFWSHDVNRFLRNKGLEEIKGREYEN